MKSPKALWAVALIGLSCLLTTVSAGRLALRPLSPQELRQALAQAGVNKDQIVPLGRATPSAVAGLGGFALGVANGLGGALIFDLLTSNETLAYVNNLIASLNSTTTNGGTTGNGGTQQEVCFASRSLNGDQLLGRADDQYDSLQDEQELYDYEDDDSDFDSADGRQVSSLDDYYYEDNVGSGGTTCIVVNRGRALIRHRRHADIEMPKEKQEEKKEHETAQSPVGASQTA